MIKKNKSDISSLVCIVIPIYKETPDNFEVTSFIQCLKVLHRYKICIVTYNSLDLSYYKNELQNSQLDYSFVYFDKSYFININSYNRLMLSVDFYKKFNHYEYILIYQLDAYIFRDELEFWCRKGYDYIGAPWFEGWHKANENSPIIGVGNGGLSLRNISKLRKLLLYVKIRSSVLNYLIRFHLNIFLSEKTLNLLSKQLYDNTNEDYYLSIIWKDYKWFNVAPIEDAIRFSFDVNPKVLYEMNNRQLPFGCHAWDRYEYESFWTQFI